MSDDRGQGAVIGLLAAILFAIGFVAFAKHADNAENSSRRKVDVRVDFSRERPCRDGCQPVQSKWVSSLADIPEEFREPNYGVRGSCVFASLITSLRWQGQHELATWIREVYSEGEYSERLIRRCDAAGIRFSYTDTGSMEWLTWATRNRLCPLVFYYDSHCVNVVDANDTTVTLLDNNTTWKYNYIPRQEFEQKWLQRYGGFSLSPIYSPPPGWPNQ